MNGTPMEKQIGQLVGNLLAGTGEVFFPGIGSLYAERRGAKRLSRRTVLPPCRVVVFSSQQRGVSLVDEIARVMLQSGEYEAPEAQAQAIYERWVERAHRVNMLTIEGVGELRFKEFVLDDAFDLRLNPQGHEPVRIRVQRRFDWALWLGVAAILIAAIYGGREFLMLYPDKPEMKTQVEVAAASDHVAIAQIPDTTRDDAFVPHEIAADFPEENERSAVVEELPQSDLPKTPMAMLSGRHYVVLGVFSTEENAKRAVQEIAVKKPAFQCRIYNFGEKFMVSPLSSGDAVVCADFIRSQGDSFPDMWTYTAR